MTGLPHSRYDNFDFLRWLAACLVVFSHQYAVSGLAEPILFGTVNPGRLGVLIFFSISGFLVTQSWLRDPHGLRFLAKRLLRIWPGIAVVTLLCACVLGPLVSTLSAQAYFAAPEFRDYLWNLKMVQLVYFLPGVFESNPYPRNVDGPLWTISIELRWYLVLLAVGVSGLLKRCWLILAATLGLTLWYCFSGGNMVKPQFEFGVYFSAGACLALFRKEWEARKLALCLSALFATGAASLAGRPDIAAACLVPILVVLAGSNATPVLKRFGRFGDLSFGIYIYAFPVQQTIAWALGAQRSFWPELLLVALITVVLAWLSWHLVEKPALNLKQHLRVMDLSGIAARLRMNRS